MIFAQEHLAEIVASNSVDESAVTGGEQLQAIRTYTQAMNAAVELLFKYCLCRDTVCVEQNDLTIATTDDNLVNRDSSDCFNAHGTSIYCECETLSFNLERTQITTCCACEEVVFVAFAISHTCVVSL
jgi:hypothetical protein